MLAWNVSWKECRCQLIVIPFHWTSRLIWWELPPLFAVSQMLCSFNAASFIHCSSLDSWCSHSLSDVFEISVELLLIQVSLSQHNCRFFKTSVIAPALQKQRTFHTKLNLTNCMNHSKSSRMLKPPSLPSYHQCSLPQQANCASRPVHLFDK